MEEVERIGIEEDPPRPAPVWVRLTCHCSGDASGGLRRVREVMVLVARARASEWPGDEQWRERLPAWFLESFAGYTLEDILENPDLWDFGSWLDAMRSPGWFWWSSNLKPESWVIHLSAYTHPYSIGALEYLSRTAGASRVVIDEPKA